MQKYTIVPLLTLFLILLSTVTYSQDSIKSIQLLFVGDVMQHLPQVNSAHKGGDVYDYEPCFRYVKNEISSADIAIANLEVPLAGKPYSGYPQFSAPDAIASTLKDVGFDILVTANNHSGDKYAKGIKRTLDVLDSFNITHTGMFHDSVDRENRYPLIVEKNGFKISVLNYTYGTNGITIPTPYIVNLIDTTQISKDLEKSKTYNPDITIACMHWGEEYIQLPNVEQKMLANFLFRKGVNLVIGAHPHVLQPIEKKYLTADGRCNNLVVYSLGNFVSNQSKPNTDGGAILKLTITKRENGICIQNVGYGLTWVYKPLENKKREYFILPAANYENSLNFMDVSDQNKLKLFLENTRKLFNKNNIGVDEYIF